METMPDCFLPVGQHLDLSSFDLNDIGTEVLTKIQRPFSRERTISPAKDVACKNNGAGPIPHTIRLKILSGRAKTTKFLKR